MRRIAAIALFALSALAIFAAVVVLSRSLNALWDALAISTFNGLLAYALFRAGACLWSPDTSHRLRRIGRAIHACLGWTLVAALSILLVLYFADPDSIESADEEALILSAAGKALGDCTSEGSTTFVDLSRIGIDSTMLEKLQANVSCRKLEPWKNRPNTSYCSDEAIGEIQRSPFVFTACTLNEERLILEPSHRLVYGIAEIPWRTGDCGGSYVAVKPFRRWIAIAEGQARYCFTATTVMDSEQ